MEELIINPDEKAVEAGLLRQGVAAAQSYAPASPAELARQGRLFVLADGLGGSASAYTAAHYAAQKVLHAYFSSSTADPQQRLLSAVRHANADLLARNRSRPERRPLATTLTAALIHQNRLLVASVGDHRMYVAWDQDIEQLTPEAEAADFKESARSNADATDKADKVADAGAPDKTDIPNKPNKSSETDAADSPAEIIGPKPAPPPSSTTPSAKSLQARLLPDSLGLTDEIDIDIFTRRLFPGDIVVLCSGSLTGYFQDNEIARAVTLHPPEQAIRRLLALAAERGCHDPAGCGVVRILTELASTNPPAEEPLPPPPTWEAWGRPPLPVSPPPPKSTKSETATDTRPMSARTPSDRFKRPPEFDQPARPPLPEWLTWKVAAGGALLLFLLLCVGLPLLARPLLPDAVANSLGLAPETAQVELPPETAVNGDDESAAIQSTTTITAGGALTATTLTQSNSPPTTPSPAAGAASSPLATPTTAAQSQADVVASAPTPTFTPSPTPPPLPTIQLPPGCENRARFVRDVTIPDGTQLDTGESFEKAWVVVNAETCPFGPGYTLRFMDGNPMGAPTTIQLREVIEPDENGELRIPMTAPTAPGSYRSEWQLHDLQGEPFGPDLYLEVEVSLPDLTDADATQLNILYDFIAQAREARWTSGTSIYNISQTAISETLPIPSPQGLVASGIAELRGNTSSESDVLLTYPDQESGYIEGLYRIDTPLQPGDTIATELGFTKLSILSDDGVTFEVAFTPDSTGQEQIIFSTPLLYQDSPITEIQPLSDISAGATGTMTLRVLGGESLSQDWAVWISARLIRP